MPVQEAVECAGDRLGKNFPQVRHALAASCADEHARHASSGCNFDQIAQLARSLRFIELVELVEDEHLRYVGRADLGDHAFDLRHLLGQYRARAVDDVQQQVGVVRFLQCGLERLD